MRTANFFFTFDTPIFVLASSRSPFSALSARKCVTSLGTKVSLDHSADTNADNRFVVVQKPARFLLKVKADNAALEGSAMVGKNVDRKPTVEYPRGVLPDDKFATFVCT